MMHKIETLKFLQHREVPAIAAKFGSPVFVYDLESMKKNYGYFSSIPNAYGLNVRYSVKANPNNTILRIFDQLGAYFDASSTWEAKRLVQAGVAAEKILMTAQEASDGWQDLCRLGMAFDAGSLEQLSQYGQAFPGSEVSLRLNPGFGSGLVKKLTSGGDHSSFGLWYAHLEQALQIAEKHRLTIKRLHFHIGSGHESTVLETTVTLALDLAERIPSVDILNLGGGYRIAAFNDELGYDHHGMGARISEQFKLFAARTQRRLKLEVEPGTALMSLAGSLITRVIDRTNTGDDGYQFIKVDGGLTELMRPSYYGARHPLISVSADGKLRNETEPYIVCGHCCIAGDNLTPVAGNSEDFTPQTLARTEIDDFIVVERTGGYAASMCVKNFNSYPEAAEILRTSEGQYSLIRQRQTLEQMVQNELSINVDISSHSPVFQEELAVS